MELQKKTLAASEQDPERRQRWRDELTTIAPERLVFVDESGTTIAMTPRAGWAPRNQRVHGQAPRNHGQNSTLLAALTLDGISAALVVEGAANGDVFETYISQVVAPTLRPGQLVIWDNLNVHKRPEARAAVEARDCQVVFLPPCSPDFNPVEQAFSKLKTALRRANQRTRDGLWDAIGEALGTITSSDASGWFTHCGYLTKNDQSL